MKKVDHKTCYPNSLGNNYIMCLVLCCQGLNPWSNAYWAIAQPYTWTVSYTVDVFNPQISQLEEEITRDWQTKCDKLVDVF